MRKSLAVPLLIVCIWGSAAPGATLIMPEALSQRLRAKADLVLVDVRSPEQFGERHISTSLNMPLFALKTKTFLKTKPLVLVGEGHSYKQLLDEAETLTKSGYQISLLDGGVYQWRRMGGPTEGAASVRDLPTITAQAFMAGRGYENWLVVDVRQSVKSVPEDRNFTQISLPYEHDPKGFIQKLKLAIANHKEKQFLTVILCDENGTHYEEMERQIQAEGVRNVVYLEGGFKAYQVSRQIRLSGPQSKSTVRSGGSANRTCVSGCR